MKSKPNLRKFFPALLASALLLSISACKSEGDHVTPDDVTASSSDAAIASAPEISTFTSTRQTISLGDTTQLRAEFTHGSGSVDHSVGTIQSGSAVTVAPPETITYVLTVTGGNTDQRSIEDHQGNQDDQDDPVSVTRSLTITVVPAPEITRFTASRLSIVPGQSSDISAVFSQGTGSIDNSIGTVSSGVAYTVSPSVTTTYLLAVSNAAGTRVTRELTITVVTASDNNNLGALELSAGSLDQTFQADQLHYTATLGYLVNSLQLSAIAEHPDASITINGIALAPDAVSQAITLSTGENTLIPIVVTAASGLSQTYTLTVTRQTAAGFAQQAYVKASNTGAGDDFGYALALSGDTLAVGAYREASNTRGIDGDQDNNSIVGAGAVYVFARSGGLWHQQAYLKASNSDANDGYGIALSLSGDTLAVGAYYEGSNATGVDGEQANNSAPGAGAVYVYTRAAGSWSQQAYIKASNTRAQTYFGYALALAGDMLAVGAYGENSGATGVDSDQQDTSAVHAGAVYIFTRSGDTWGQQAYLKASNAEASDNFGVALSLSGNTLAVGAYREASGSGGINGDKTNNSAPAAGAVYVFTHNQGVWNEQAYLKASNPEECDNFGYALALSGDTLAVGAFGEDSSATGIDGSQTNNGAANAGAVYVFTRYAEVWSQQAYIKATNAGTADNFGAALALTGDTLAVGAYGEAGNSTGIDGHQGNDSASQSGAVYIFTRSDGTWSQQTYIKASNTNASDQFGRSLALSGGTLMIGAHWEDSSATGIDGDQADNSRADAGAVYIFQ